MIVGRCDFEVGNVIDAKYRIEQILGQGSFGNVYKVRDANHNVIALKLLRLWEVSSDIRENLVKRFKIEYETGRMNCKYFVHSFDYGEVKGNPYFTMEYCSQGDLSHFKGDINSWLPKIAHDALSGLDILHSSGMVHRDIKPENLMLKDNNVVALTDFGIVGDKNRRLTKVGILSRRPKQVFGTYIYMSPEQIDRKGHGVTYLPTTDIFSLGVVFFELLTGGKYPFGPLESHDELTAYQYNAKHEIWNRELIRYLPNGRIWEHVIGKCLKADYRERYQYATEVMADIPFIRKKVSRPSALMKVRSLMITFGCDVGRIYSLFDLLSEHKRILRVGREEDNDIVIKEMDSSFSSRYHCTLELDADNRTWYIRDGQWNIESKSWIASTNGTLLNTSLLTSERTLLRVGDIITIGDLKLIVNNN